MTIYQIKREAVNGEYYFSRETLKFFGQKLSDFKVRKIGQGVYFIYAPAKRGGRVIFYSMRIYIAENRELKHLPGCWKRVV